METLNQQDILLETDTIEASSVVNWVQQQVQSNASLCIPFSGGIDSATCLALATEAVGAQRVIALHVGHTSTKPEETENANQIADLLNINLLEVNLTELAGVHRESLRNVLELIPSSQLEGVEATQNAALIYTFTREISRLSDSLIVGTLDLAECLTGFFPKGSFYGDFMPIGGLFRTEVRKIARQLDLPDLPEAFAVVPGCGSISSYVNQLNDDEIVAGELNLDLHLAELLQFSESISDTDISGLCKQMSHKSREALTGRNVFYPNEKRRIQVENFILK